MSHLPPRLLERIAALPATFDLLDLVEGYREAVYSATGLRPGYDDALRAIDRLRDEAIEARAETEEAFIGGW